MRFLYSARDNDHSSVCRPVLASTHLDGKSLVGMEIFDRLWISGFSSRDERNTPYYYISTNFTLLILLLLLRNNAKSVLSKNGEKKETFKIFIYSRRGRILKNESERISEGKRLKNIYIHMCVSFVASNSIRAINRARLRSSRRKEIRRWPRSRLLVERRGAMRSRLASSEG